MYVAGAGVVAVQRPTFEAELDSGSGFVTLDRVSRCPGSPLPAETAYHSHSGAAARPGRIDCAADHAAEGGASTASLADRFGQDFSDSSGLQTAAPAVEPAGVCGRAEARHRAVGEEPASSPTEQQHSQQQPPEWLLRGVAAALRHNTEIQLFNFDLLTPTTTSASATAISSMPLPSTPVRRSRYRGCAVECRRLL